MRANPHFDAVLAGLGPLVQEQVQRADAPIAEGQGLVSQPDTSRLLNLHTQRLACCRTQGELVQYQNPSMQGLAGLVAGFVGTHQKTVGRTQVNGLGKTALKLGNLVSRIAKNGLVGAHDQKLLEIGQIFWNREPGQHHSISPRALGEKRTGAAHVGTNLEVDFDVGCRHSAVHILHQNGQCDLRSGLHKICMAEQSNDIALQWLRCRIAAQNQQKEGQ